MNTGRATTLVCGGVPVTLTLLPNDPSAAKKLLSDAGFPQGFATELWYAPNFSVALPDPKAIADALAADLGKAGITATVRASGPDTFARLLGPVVAQILRTESVRFRSPAHRAGPSMTSNSCFALSTTM